MASSEEDIFKRLMAKQQELERMRAAIKELQSLEDAEEDYDTSPGPVVEEVQVGQEEAVEEEEEGGDDDDQATLIATLLQKRDELLHMQVRRSSHRACSLHTRGSMIYYSNDWIVRLPCSQQMIANIQSMGMDAAADTAPVVEDVKEDDNQNEVRHADTRCR